MWPTAPRFSGADGATPLIDNILNREWPRGFPTPACVALLCAVLVTSCGRDEIALDATLGVPIGITAAATPGVKTGTGYEEAPTVDGWATPVQATSRVTVRAPGGEIIFDGGPSRAWLGTDAAVMVHSIEVQENEARPFAGHQTWTDETLAALRDKGWSWSPAMMEVAPRSLDEAHWASCAAAPDARGEVERIGGNVVGWPTLHWRRGVVHLEVGVRFRCWRHRESGEIMVSRVLSFGVAGPNSF